MRGGAEGSAGGREAEVEVHGISSEGAGVATLPEGKVIFVHRTAPGDRVRLEVMEEKSRWARGELREVISSGPGRRPPLCPHYERCGGCTLEHLRYQDQLRWKARIVADALERIGDISVDPPPVEPSPREFRYRSRVRFTLRRDGGGEVVAGFHELDRPDEIVDVDEGCLLPDEAVAEAWGSLRREWGEGAEMLPGGRELHLTLRRARQGVVLVVHGGEGPGDPDRLLERVPELAAVWRSPSSREEPELLAGTPGTDVTWLGERISVRGSAFLQVNRPAAEKLQEAVLGSVEEPRDLRVVDGYCGAGIFGRSLARRGARVVGIEVDSLAVEAARTGSPAGFVVFEGRVEDRLTEAFPAELVILNPPRSGLDDGIPGILAKGRPGRVLYVSCDPATLARDAHRMRGSYRLRDLRAFDLFPQTAHVEVVADFTLREGG